MGIERYTEAEQKAYFKYIESPQWKAKRKLKIAAAGNRCEWVTTDYSTGVDTRCARTRYLQVHHNTYVRLGNEWDCDLDVYCWFHHIIEHLLWEHCWRCTGPKLECDVLAEHWLNVVLRTKNIDLDTGPVNYSQLPKKYELVEALPKTCDTCLAQLGLK